MKIGVLVTGSQSENRSDQWLTCRCEARAGINAGYGFALLGHEVDIVSIRFEDADNVFPGVNFRKHWNLDKQYDVLWVWIGNAGKITFDNYRMAIVMVEPSNSRQSLQALQASLTKGKLYTVSKKYLPIIKETYKVDLSYFPLLFPIPCLPGLEKQDFLEFKFDKEKKDINVWVFLNSWPNYHIECDARIYEILKELKFKYNFNMNVTVLKGGKNKWPHQCNSIISEFNATVVESESKNYLDILNMLSNSDICITKGSTCYCGNCAYDIISLGKLMIYVTEGTLPTNINDLYGLSDFVIRHEENKEGVVRKLELIMSNPEACYNAMKQELITYSFPEWSKIINGILSEIS